MKLPPCVQTCSHARSSLAYERVMEVEDSASDGGSGDSDSWEKVSIPETSAVEEQSSPEDKVVAGTSAGEDPMTSSISASSNIITESS